MKRVNLVAYLDKLLAIGEFGDNSWNGLQFEGKDEVKKVVSAVDAGVEIFEKAAEMKADFLMVHHGQFWTGSNPSLVGWNKKRVDVLYEHQISLYGAHLPLDRHAEFGNNALLLQMIGAEKTGDFLEHRGTPIGWTGRLENEKSASELSRVLARQIGEPLKVLDFGKTVKTVAVCSGGGGYGAVFEAIGLGVDLLITGDTAEVYQTAKDAGLNVIFAGHHGTEIVGVRALGEHVAEKFGVEFEWLDVETGL